MDKTEITELLAWCRANGVRSIDVNGLKAVIDPLPKEVAPLSRMPQQTGPVSVKDAVLNELEEWA